MVSRVMLRNGETRDRIHVKGRKRLEEGEIGRKFSK